VLSGEELEPEFLVHELSDKRKINFWYKLPHEMLQHYAPIYFAMMIFFIYLVLISL